MLTIDFKYRYYIQRFSLKSCASDNFKGQDFSFRNTFNLFITESILHKLGCAFFIPEFSLINNIIGICNRFFTESLANIDKQKSGVEAGRSIEPFTQISLIKGEKSGGNVFTFHDPRLSSIRPQLIRLKFRYSSNLRNFFHFVKKFMEAWQPVK